MYFFETAKMRALIMQLSANDQVVVSTTNIAIYGLIFLLPSVEEQTTANIENQTRLLKPFTFFIILSTNLTLKEFEELK